MADLEALVECHLDITRFYNIDLHCAGYYQIRVHLKPQKKQPFRVEIVIPRVTASHLFPASVVNGRAVGTTFEIMYKAEDVTLKDLVLFKIFYPLYMNRLPDVLHIYMVFELWFIEKKGILTKSFDDMYSKFKCVSSRSVRVNLPLLRGLHYRRPLLFDYSHLCAFTFTLHASLVGLDFGSKTLFRSRTGGGNVFYLTPDEVFFRNAKTAEQRCKNAFELHHSICRLLLTAYESLELKLKDFLFWCPTHSEIRIRSVDCAKKFEILHQNVQRCIEECETAQHILSNVKLLSGELLILWKQFIQVVASQPNLNSFLSGEHHQSRVRRFAASFFSCESSCASILSESSDEPQKLHDKIVDVFRKSDYFYNLPDLSVCCDEVDGAAVLTPVIFEHVYQATRCKEPSAIPQPDNARIKKLLSALKYVCTPDYSRDTQAMFWSLLNGDDSAPVVRLSRTTSCRQLCSTAANLSGTPIRRSRSLDTNDLQTGDASASVCFKVGATNGVGQEQVVKNNAGVEKVGPQKEDQSWQARLTSGVDQAVLDFVSCKEKFKQQLRATVASFDGQLRSDSASFPSRTPYFDEVLVSGDRLTDMNTYLRQYPDHSAADFHLIVCVHGLEGSSTDLKMIRTYLELALPPDSANVRFLMSWRNNRNTFHNFETMAKTLADELLHYLSQCQVQPSKISFIGHSLGNVIIRSALTDPRLEFQLDNLHTFLSLNGPHCGLLYNNSSVVNIGIRLVQRLRSSASLQQLSLKDHEDIRQSFLYTLSQKPCLEYFKNVLLVGSYDDSYVPMHSALIEHCNATVRDSSLLSTVYSEMVGNLLQPLEAVGSTTLVRYSVYHSPRASSGVSYLLGRAAHVAVLDSDLFIEKLLTVSALKYFL